MLTVKDLEAFMRINEALMGDSSPRNRDDATDDNLPTHPAVLAGWYYSHLANRYRFMLGEK